MSEPTPKDDPSTLTLPRTDLPLAPDPSTLEPQLIARWKHQRTFEAMVTKNAGRPAFVLHGAPTSPGTGPLSADQVLQAVREDLVVKYRALGGYQADFANTRHHQLERLGVLGHFDAASPALTTEAQLLELATIAEKGLLVRALRPTWWCPVDQTALADAEVQLVEHRDSPSAFVAFEVTADLSHLSSTLTGRRVCLAVWTTTPWTLSANVAIAVHPDLEYVAYALDDARAVVVAKDLLLPTLSTIAPGHLKTTSVKLGEGTFDATALSDKTRVLAYALGSDLEGLVYRHPLLSRGGLVIPGTHVALEAGTGLMHTAPGHDRQDFTVGQAHGLAVLQPVTADGRFDDSVPERLRGLTIAEANPVLLQWLEEVGALLNPRGETVTTTQPTCRRCATPLVSRVTPQWCLSVEGLRPGALEAVDHAIDFTPPSERARVHDLLETRDDWGVSGQFPGGVPFPAVICEDCGQARADAALMRRFAERVRREGPLAGHQTPLEHLLPNDFRCHGCGSSRFRRESELLDPAFGAACSFALVSRRLERPLPFDLSLGAGEQHRTWLANSLLVSLATRGVVPVRASWTHGEVVDGEGKRDALLVIEDLIERVGADPVRLWVAGSDARGNVRLTWPIIERAAQNCRALQSTVRVALSNLVDFDPAVHAVAPARLEPLDQWVLARLDALIVTVRRAFDALEFHVVVQALLDFCANELSGTWFALQQRVLADGPKRRSAQTALFRLAHDLLVMLAPITSFASEEAFSWLPGSKPASVFLADFPVSPAVGNPGIVAEVERLLSVRTALRPLLEVARREKRLERSEDACLRVSATGDLRALLERWRSDLPELFMVSEVHLVADATNEVWPELKADVTLSEQ
jgi:isoleucyl-tRNA synthetase